MTIKTMQEKGFEQEETKQSSNNQLIFSYIIKGEKNETGDEENRNKK